MTSLNAFEVYNITANSWQVNGPTLPNPIYSHMCAYSSTQRRVYTFGGLRGFSNVIRRVFFIDLDSHGDDDEWQTSEHTLSVKRCCGAAVTLYDDKNDEQSAAEWIYVIGGHDGSEAVQTVDSLDVVHDAWFSYDGLNERRSFFAAIVTSSGDGEDVFRIWLFGGHEENALNSIEVSEKLVLSSVSLTVCLYIYV